MKTIGKFILNSGGKHFLRARLLVIAFILLTCLGCSRDDCKDESSRFDMEVSEVQSTSMEVRLTVVPPPCESYGYGVGTGVKISTSPITGFDSEGLDVGEGGKTGFQTLVEGLTPNTKYYLRPYITINLSRYEFGPQEEVTTLP